MTGSETLQAFTWQQFSREVQIQREWQPLLIFYTMPAEVVHFQRVAILKTT